MANILVVDDEKWIVELLETALLENGHSVMTANDGIEAFEIFLRSNFDIIVTDISMPKENGIAFVEKVFDSGANVPVIVISGGMITPSSELTLEHAQEIPIVHWTLKKPFSPFELSKIIDTVNRYKHGING